jgi:hypothetical protein
LYEDRAGKQYVLVEVQTTDKKTDVIFAKLDSIKTNHQMAPLSAYLSINKFDTGGYTGDWNSSEGRLAMLHEKEIILNKHDTANFLDALTILRDLNLSMMRNLTGLNSNYL